MEFWSSISEKVIDTTASIIVGIAVHIPYLLHALMGLPMIPIGPSGYSVPEQVTVAVPVATTTHNQKPVREYSTYRAFPFEDYFAEETNSLVQEPYVNASSTHAVALKLLTDQVNQHRNNSFAVYLDGKNVGEIAGQGIAVSKFSLDQSRVLIRTRNVIGCAGMCQTFDLYVLDFVHYDLVRIPRPQEKVEYQNTPKSVGFTDVTEFVYLNPWVSNHEIAIGSYFVGIGSDGKLYQVTSGDAWIYNLDTREYRIYPGED